MMTKKIILMDLIKKIENNDGKATAVKSYEIIPNLDDAFKKFLIEEIQKNEIRKKNIE